jgi:Holliday junction resolvase RusA-like endonuclease
MGKQRARHGKGRHLYTPNKTVAAQQTIGVCAIAARSKMKNIPRMNGHDRIGVILECHFRASPPTVAQGACPTVADSDNIEKLVFDALKNIFYEDDRQIDFNQTRRFWNQPDDILRIMLASLR